MKLNSFVHILYFLIYNYVTGSQDVFRGYGIATVVILVTYFAFDCIVLRKANHSKNFIQRHEPQNDL